MSLKLSPVSKWTQLSFAAVLIIFVGCLHSMVAQGPLPAISANRSPNPPVDAKRQAIKRAIEEGNKARDESEFERALASYRKVAEELDRNDPRAFYGLGNVYSDLACSDNAIKAYRDALRLKKDYRDAIIALGYAYANKERVDEAEAQFRLLLNLNKKDVAADIGLALVARKRKQYQDAISRLTLISENRSIHDQDRALAHLSLGEIYMEQKKYLQAAVEFKTVINSNHFLPGAYVKLGQTELFPAMSRFSLLVNQEVTIADRERVIKAAKFAADNIRKAIIEYNYKHPIGNLLLANALTSQFSYIEAENNLQLYLTKVKDLEKQLGTLIGTCDYGFNQLYAFGYYGLALNYNQRSQRETDNQKKAEYEQRVIENANRMMQLKESDPAAYLMLGQVYMAKRQWREAIEQFAKALTYEANADNKVGIYEIMGQCYSNLDQPDDAIAAFKEALKIRPASASSRWGLARVYETKGDFDEAIRLKKEAMGDEPTASTYWLLASTYFARARQKKIDADYEEAIRLLKKSLEINRGFAPAYFLLGQVYKMYKGGVHADEAIANYEMAIKYDPNDAANYLHMGDLYYSVKKNNDAAISYLRQAVKLNPNHAGAHSSLGMVYHDVGNDAEAIKSFREAIRSDDKYQDAYYGLIIIYRSQKNHGEAINLLNRVFEIAPKEFWPYKEAAKTYEDQAKNEDAIRYYQQATSFLNSEDTFGKELYACRIERLRRNYVAALRCFQNLKPPTSEDPGQQAYDIGLTYVASGDKKAALAEYEKLKQLKSGLAGELIGKINEMK